MAMRTSEPDQNRPIRDLLRRLIKAPAVLAILWPAFLVFGGYIAWHRWGSEHVAQQYYHIDLESISVTPAPKYVRSNVTQTVYHNTAMDGLSLLDRAATAKIASAFSMHPWVRKVKSVRKLPGGTIDVRLEYREPVAMARVYKPHYGSSEKYYLPVDRDGVLLPSEEFARRETQDYLRINVVGADSNSHPGSPFGDPRVEAAASLAAILAPFRQQLGLESIEVGGDPRLIQIPQLEIIDKNDKRWIWGSAPGFETAGERTAEMKLQTLLSDEIAEINDLRTIYR